MKTTPTKNLFTLRHKPYAVACHTCHPDDERTVILFECPSQESKGQGLTVSARYINGRYCGVMTSDPLPIVLTNTVWMESPMSDGPFYVANVNTNTIARNPLIDKIFHDAKAAAMHVNELNMVSMGNPTYTVVDGNGILIDHEGFYTKHIIGQYRYAETIDNTKQCINLNFGDKS